MTLVAIDTSKNHGEATPLMEKPVAKRSWSTTICLIITLCLSFVVAGVLFANFGHAYSDFKSFSGIGSANLRVEEDGGVLAPLAPSAAAPTGPTREPTPAPTPHPHSPTNTPLPTVRPTQQGHLFCFHHQSIVHKIDYNGITQSVMIKDVHLGDMLLSDLNDVYSKVIDITHYNIYESSHEKAYLREICVDDDAKTCVTATYDHLLYVNGINVDHLKTVKSVNIGDKLYHARLKKFVVVVEINENLLDYFRNVITENGNIIVDGGIYASTIPFWGEDVGFKFNEKWTHLGSLVVVKSLYRIFTLNGLVDCVWNSDYFGLYVRTPGKNAMMKWFGIEHSLLSEKYQLPMSAWFLWFVVIPSVLCYFFWKKINLVLCEK